jgi:tRNA pseudouridine38-40 synthase
MPRYKLTIEYDGTPFCGWQRQDNGPSVQEALEKAVFAFSGECSQVGGAGRTDTGVHARGQVGHLQLERDWRPDVVRDAMNAHLRPQPVAVVACEMVDGTFDARFSAIARHYAYIIIDRRAPLALERERAWQVPRALDHEAMHEAAQHLVGLHDFTTFRAAECQSASPVKTMDRLDVTREGHAVVVRASARSFLHHQIRSITGSLKMVGDGKWHAGDLKAALEARDRRHCAALAPPEGLYLMRVDYPAEGAVPK